LGKTPADKNARPFVKVSPQKYSTLPKFGFIAPTLARHKGRIAIVTNRGLGCDGRDGVERDEALQGGLTSVSNGPRANDTTLTASSHGFEGEHTPAFEFPAKTCADGEVVWS
jgi:hypothetical protein